MALVAEKDSGADRVIRKVDNLADIEIPSIGVKNYPVWKNEDESDYMLMQRANAYADELIRRHNTGEPYSVGYRLYDQRMRNVIHIVRDGKTLQKVLGIDDDFKEYDEE